MVGDDGPVVKFSSHTSTLTLNHHISNCEWNWPRKEAALPTYAQSLKTNLVLATLTEPHRTGGVGQIETVQITFRAC